MSNIVLSQDNREKKTQIAILQVLNKHYFHQKEFFRIKRWKVQNAIQLNINTIYR